MMKQDKSVLVAISGGIDSSVAAFLLKNKGFQVKGIFFQLIDEDNIKNFKSKHHPDFFTGEQRAELAAKKLEIPLYKIDYRKQFREIVINDFINKYQKGITPNPCILCNKEIKFSLLLDYALKKDIQSIATGHYVRVQRDGYRGKYLLKRGLDPKKEQSYFLYRITQDILSKSVFPLGNLTKIDVEKMALEIGLASFSVKESQEICFITGKNYRKMMPYEGERKNQTGYFVDTSGNILGKHKGIAFYTIGQRRKIGLSLNSRKYIVRIDPKKKLIMIGDEADLYQRECQVEKIHYVSIRPILGPTKLQVQIRYQAYPASATLFPHHKDRLKIVFDKPQRAITPGQSAVFYDHDVVIGGGNISTF